MTALFTYVGVPAARRISLRCPACERIGVFEPIANVQDAGVMQTPSPSITTLFAQRVCPNEACARIVWCAIELRTGKLLQAFPRPRFNLDLSSLPAKVLASMREAVSCHAEGCYVAAAMMIRKALEEVCEDRGAKGANLRDRIASLKDKVVLPVELLSALDDLRLLGNDAAHVEAKTYDSVSSEEVEAALEVTKEILKSVYQLEGLVARLRALKKQPS